ncbi:MAG: cell division protein ZapA [Cryomorphaceae bacterium]|jgi:cell division protein ZapA|nr:cell division protein ZapA [Cryomorphaceae bacterium]MDP4827358.1 cell division protein ZapA [Flavobacteriales bacterium]
MSELSIKVKIAGRQYPLTIKRDEEELIREAAKKVDDNVKFFQENYAVKDRQDLIAMTALQMATLALKAQKQPVDNSLLSELEDIRKQLQDALA